MKTENSNTRKIKITSFPVQSLTTSIELVAKIVKGRGEVGSTLKEIAITTGIGEGSLPLPISTCCQYGIYESVYGTGYKTTELFQRIYLHSFIEDKKKAIFEALSNPPLYKRLLNDFNGKVLPDEKGFTNYLIKEFGFKPYAIPRIVKAFFENFQEYIDGNNKLRFILSPVQNGNEKYTVIPESDNTQPPQRGQDDFDLPPDSSKNKGYTVHIFGEGINSKLSLTEPEDFVILEAMISKVKKKINVNQ